MEGSSFGSFGKDAIRIITIGFRLGIGLKVGQVLTRS